MDATLSAAWIQAGTAIVLCLFTAATAWLFYQINQLHSRIGSLRRLYRRPHADTRT